MLFEQYIAHRPTEMCSKDSPFWLAINYQAQNGKFLKKQRMGEKKINTLVKEMVANIASAEGHRFRNHSTRKTFINSLLQNQVERSDICQLSGHRNVQSIDSYAHTPVETQRRMSSLINSQIVPASQQSPSSSTSVSAISPASVVASLPISSVVQSANLTLEESSFASKLASFFSGAKFENSTVNVNISDPKTV